MATRVLAGVLALAAVTYVFLVARGRIDVAGTTYFSLVDDTMISMRYAANLAGGHGLVWNIGEAPVQGFTNLGYTLVLALFHLLPVPRRFESVLPFALTTAALLATAIATHRIVHRLRPGRVLPAALAAGLVAFDFGLVFWSTRGMEVSLIAAPLMLASLYALRHADGDARALPWVAAMSTVGILVRLDAAPSFVIVFGALLLAEAGARDRALRVIRWGLVPAAAVAAVLVFQRSYFGDWFPNTYYLKTEGVSAGERLEVGWNAFLENAVGQLSVLVILAVLGFALRDRDRPLRLVMFAGLAVTPILYSIWVGGDYAEPQVHAPNRFMLLAVPPLIVLVAVGASDIADRLRPHLRAVALPLTICVVALAALAPNVQNWGELTHGAIPLWSSDRNRTRLGVHLEATTPPETLIATHTAGQIPYYSERPVVDLLGKSDRIVARSEPAAPFRPGHNKWDYEYSIGGLQPDVVADEWGQVAAYLADSGDYQRLDNGLWVRTEPSVQLDIVALAACYTACPQEAD